MNDDPTGFGLTSGQQILAILGGLATAFLTWVGVRGKTKVEGVAVVQNGFQSLVDQLQEERGDNRKRIIDLEGRIAGLEAYNYALETILRNNGIPLPERPKVDKIIMLGDDPKGVH